MRLPLDIIYRPPLTEKSRADYANDVRCTLEQAYETVREKLHLAHERQKDYYDRRSHGSRYQSGDSVWLFNPAPQKGVAPKFLEQWTGPYKVTKRLSDVTYEIFDARRQTTKIVHFDRLKKSTVAPRPDIPKNSAKELSSSDSDSQESGDYVPLSAPIARKRGRPPKLRPALPLTAPALDERRVNLAKPPNVHQQGKPPTTVPPTVPSTILPGMLPTMMPTVINRQVSVAVEEAVAPPAPESSDALRVSNRTTKGQPPIRFCHSGYVAFLITILFLVLVNGADSSPIPPWNNMSPEDAPILDGAVLWHPLERAILLSEYQFVIVACKVLPPKTSNGKFLCGGVYNSTEISAPEWYLQWEREIENWTQRSLTLTTIPNSEVGTRVRLARNTRTINFTKREECLFPNENFLYLV